MVSELTGFLVEQSRAQNLSRETQGNVLFSVLRPGCCKGRRAVVWEHWRYYCMEDKQDKLLSAPTCTHAWLGRADYTSPCHQTTSEITPPWLLSCIHSFIHMEILYELNGLIAITSHAVKTWAYSNMIHLLLAQAAIGKETSSLLNDSLLPPVWPIQQWRKMHS